jgi:hypothetical protein
MRFPRVVPCAALATLLAGCAPSARPRGPWEYSPASRGATVAVQNHGDTDVTIYAANADRGRRRIGTVMRGCTDNLVIPENVLGWWSTHLIAVPVGGGVPSALTCPPIDVGTRLLLVIERESVLSTCGRAARSH